MTVAVTDNRRFLGVSLLATLVTAAALVFLNLDGYHNEFPILVSFNQEPPSINWTHGWPLRVMVRSSIYVPSAGIAAPTPAAITGNDIAISSRWPFDGAPFSYFYPRQFAVDIVFFLVVVVGTAFGAQRFARRLNLRLRFGLKFLFGLTTIVALILALSLSPSLPRQVAQFAAMAIIGLALLLMLYGALDILPKRTGNSDN